MLKAYKYYKGVANTISLIIRDRAVFLLDNTVFAKNIDRFIRGRKEQHFDKSSKCNVYNVLINKRLIKPVVLEGTGKHSQGILFSSALV